MDERRRGLRISDVVGLVACVALTFVAVGTSELAAQDETQIKLLSIGDLWSYFKGVEEPDPDWNQPTYDDRDWEIGASPFGYGDTVGGTQLTDMMGNYLSVYIRNVFVVEDLASIAMVVLNIKYDDGAVVYLNGEEIARLSMSGTKGDPVPFDRAGTDHEASSVQPVVLTCDDMGLLTQGENLIAIQGHNVNLTSSDLVIEPELVAVTTVCPTEMTAEERTNGAVRVRWTRPFTSMRYDFLELRRNGELVEEQPRATSSLYTDDTPLPGTSTYELKVGLCEQFCTMSVSITIGSDEPMFRRGDTDNNGSVNLSDALVILNSLFQGAGTPACLDAADTNDDGTFNLSDGIFLLGSLFQGSAQPPAPGTTTCGPDPSADTLAACEYGAACQ